MATLISRRVACLDNRCVAGNGVPYYVRRRPDLILKVVRSGGFAGLVAQGELDTTSEPDSERLELTHRAGNRDIFARGALAAAIWIAGREPGTYTFDQVLAPE